jgi:hypothetical protein
MEKRLTSYRVWTHHMKDISFVDVFTRSCATSNITLTQSPEPHKAFTVGAGVQDGEISQAAAQENLTVVGGSNVVSQAYFRSECLLRTENKRVI